MRIKVLFFAALREVFGERTRFVEIRDGASIHEVVQGLSHESKDFVLNKIPLIFAVNGDFESGERPLRDRDELALMMPMSGG